MSPRIWTVDPGHFPASEGKEHWRFRSACRDVDDPELFYPTHPPATRAYREQAGSAKAICAGCPVSALCRAEVDADERDLPFTAWDGIWAGEDRWERAKRRRVRNPRAAPSTSTQLPLMVLVKEPNTGRVRGSGGHFLPTRLSQGTARLREAVAEAYPSSGEEAG